MYNKILAAGVQKSVVHFILSQKHENQTPQNKSTSSEDENGPEVGTKPTKNNLSDAKFISAVVT